MSLIQDSRGKRLLLPEHVRRMRQEDRAEWLYENQLAPVLRGAMPFVQYSELGSMVHSEARALGAIVLDPATEAKLGMSLAELELSVRATNCLESENITTVRDLVTRSEEQLLEVRNFGETTLAEVREKLSDIGLRLGMRLAPASVGTV